MDFQDTGLPNTRSVFNAYNFYSRMQELKQTRGLTVAQQLADAGCANEKAIILALLCDMPDSVFAVMNAQFGPWLGLKIREVHAQYKADFDDLSFASDEVKLYCIADHILRAQKDLAISPYWESAFDDIRGSTSCPALEKKCLALFEATEPTHIDFDDTDELMDFPGFDELELLDHPQVRAAYQLVKTDPRTRARSFNCGIFAAELLSDVPKEKKPAVVAAALLGIAIGEEASAADIDAWLPLIGEEACGILLNGNLHSDNYEDDLGDSCDEDMAHIILAFSIARVNMVYGDVFELMQLANKGSGVDHNMLQSKMLAHNRDVVHIWQTAAPMIDRVSAPELANELKQCIEETMSIIVSNMPPKRPKPPGHF